MLLVLLIKAIKPKHCFSCDCIASGASEATCTKKSAFLQARFWIDLYVIAMLQVKLHIVFILKDWKKWKWIEFPFKKLE